MTMPECRASNGFRAAGGRLASSLTKYRVEISGIPRRRSAVLLFSPFSGSKVKPRYFSAVGPFAESPKSGASVGLAILEARVGVVKPSTPAGSMAVAVV